MGDIGCHGNMDFDPIYAKTLCSLSPTPVMMHINFDQDWPVCFRDIQVRKWTRSNMGIFGTKGQVTPKQIVQSGGLNSNSSEIICMSRLSASHKDPIKSKKAMLCTRSNMSFFGTQVTAKTIVRSGWNSNLSAILWQSWLPASSKMIL